MTTLLIHHRVPFAALLMAVVLAFWANFAVTPIGTAVLGGRATTTMSAQAILEVNDAEAQSIVAGGFWRGVAITALCVAVVVGVGVATGGLAVVAYSLAVPAVATSWTAGAGLIVTGVTVTAKSSEMLAGMSK